MDRFKEESGVALVYVIVVMSVVFLLVSGIITVSMHENVQSLYQSEEVMAYYVSRAGAQAMVLELKRMHKTHYEQFQNEQSATATDVLVVGDQVDVSVQKNGDYYDIESLGTYKGHTARTSIRMEYVERYDFDYAAYAYSDMGTSAANGAISIKNIVGGLASGGDIYVKDADIGPTKAIPEDEIIPHYQHDIDIIVPDTAGINITGSNVLNNPSGDQSYDLSTQITNLSLNNTQSITINTNKAEYEKEPYEDFDTKYTLTEVGEGNGDYMILRIADRGSAGGGIVIEGDKDLLIVVDDALYVGNGIEIVDENTDGHYAKVEIYVVDESNDSGDDFTKTGGNNGDYDFVVADNKDFGIEDELEHLKVFLYGEVDATETITVMNTMAMNNNSDFYGYILGPQATVDLKNGQTNIYGSVYANTINFDAEVSIENPDSYVTSEAIYKEMQIAYWE